MRFLGILKAFGRFWYDFIIGDEWKIAAGVVLAVAVLVALLRSRVLGDHALAALGGVIIIGFFAASLMIDARPPRNQKSKSRRRL